MSGGVVSGPNRSRMTATVVDAAQSPDSAEKWTMRLRVENNEPIEGGSFATPGDEVDAMAFELPEPVAAGARITADAEYVGGPFGGVFRLGGVSLQRPSEDM